MAVDFGDDDLTDIVAENETVGSFGDFGETEIPDDFFDHWSHVGSEDDDNSDEEIALVAFDESLGCVPETEVSELEGTSGDVEQVQEKGKECAHCKNDWSHEVGCQGYKEDDDDVSTECPSLTSKDNERDSDSDGCPELAPRVWRWGDEDSDSESEDSIEYPKPMLRGAIQGGSVSDSDDDSIEFPGVMKRGSVQGSSVSSSDSDDDLSCNENWAPWSQSGKTVEMETILLASEADDKYEDCIGKCRECGGKGMIGNLCSRCEDSGMIYEHDSGDESEEDTDSTEIDDEAQIEEVFTEADLTEIQQYWLRDQMSDAEIETVRELLIELPVLVLNWKLETGEEVIHEDDQRRMMRAGIKFVEENAVHEYKKVLRGEAALPVIDGDVIDGETALEACVKTPKMKRFYEGYNDKILKNTWIADSGASTHMGNSDEGMTDVREIDSPVQIGNGKTLRATKIGRKHVTVLSKDGTTTNIVLEDYKYVPDLWVNLFAVTKSLRNGWKISNDGVTLYLRKGESEVKFDKAIKTHKGLIIGADMMARVPDVANVASAPFASGKTINVNVMHRALGHPSEDTTRRTAAFYGLKLSGEMDPCIDCAEAKSRQRNVNKESEGGSDIAGERLFIDISSVKKKSLGGSKFWLLILDDCTDQAWSHFLKKKDHQVKILIEFIKDLKAHGKVVKYIRCDNAGENISFENECKKEGLGIKFEYTSPNSPQFNGRVERKFATLYSRVRANLNGAKLNMRLRDLLWAEAAATSTIQENVYVTKRKQKSSYEQFYGKELPGWRHMRQFGEIGIVSYGTNDNSMRPKHLNRGRACMHLGRAVDRPKDTYKFLNLKTKRIISSRDVTWVQLVYGDYVKLPQEQIARFESENEEGFEYESDDDTDMPELVERKVQFEDSDDEDESDDEYSIVYPNEGDEYEDPDHVEETGPIDPKVAKEMSRLSTYYNSGQTLSRTRSGRNYEEQDDSDDDSDDDNSNDGGDMYDVASLILDRMELPTETVSWVEKSEFAMNATDMKKYETMDKDKIPPSVCRDTRTAPTTFEEAWSHPDEWQRKMWRGAVNKEFGKMRCDESMEENQAK